MMSAKPSMGICPGGEGVKGCACLGVSSLGPAQGLGSICGDKPHTQQDGAGWLRSAELHAQWGEKGTHHALAPRQNCGVPRMRRWGHVPFREDAYVGICILGRAVQAELFLHALHF